MRTFLSNFSTEDLIIIHHSLHELYRYYNGRALYYNAQDVSTLIDKFDTILDEVNVFNDNTDDSVKAFFTPNISLSYEAE